MKKLNRLGLIIVAIVIAGLSQMRAAADSIVQITAEVQGLTQVSPDQLPPFGTYWLAMPNASFAPSPCPPWDPLLPVYGIANSQYLVDDTGGQLPPGNTITAMEIESNAVVNLINQVQTATAVQSAGMTMAMDSSLPLPEVGGGGDNGGYTNNYIFNNGFDTNLLWLQITNVANGTAYANLYNATNQVYSIWSTTNLTIPFVDWQVETEVFPTNGTTNCLPLTVSTLGRQALFLRAQDWTGVTSNGNQTPEWWFWYYFGTINLSDDDLDSGANTLLHDYQYGINPNPSIGFSVQYPNRVQNNVFDATVTIYNGEPFYEAVLVNDTNTANAVWQPYNGTNIAVPLNFSNGIYTVSIGLRGRPSNAAATWVPARVVLENLALALTVTSPAGGVVSQPVIQVQGLASETLSNLTYDVSNVLGVVSNQQGYWSPSYFDTNVDDFTTNTFQCYDVQLANGMNSITLYATDSQGNTTTSSVNYTLDYSYATPPVLSVLWPPNGTVISGSNFTLQAQVDDDTATVTAQIVDTNGDTNTVPGLVERSGLIWINNLPLAAGTNIVTIIAAKAAGLSVTTNLTLVQSSAVATVNPLNQFNQTAVSVTGTVSDPSSMITVNGTNAYYLDDEGDWEADNVPVSPTGTATLDVEVYSGASLNIGSQVFAMAQPPVVAMMSYTKSDYQTGGVYNWCSQGPTGGPFSEIVAWLYQTGGSDSSWSSSGLDGDCDYWEAVSSTVVLAGGYNGYSPTWEINSGQFSYYSLLFSDNPWIYSSHSENYSTSTEAMVMPMGQASFGQTVLYLVGAQVFDEDTGNQLPASALQFKNQVPGTVAMDVTNSGSVWTVFMAQGPAGTNLVVTPQAAGRNIAFNPPWQVTNATLQIFDANSGVNLSGQTNTVIVGQQMNLTCQLSITNSFMANFVLTNFQWTVPGYAISNYIVAPDTNSAIVVTNFPLNNSNVVFYWVAGATNRMVQCSATVNGATVTGQATFNILTPSVKFTDGLSAYPMLYNGWMELGDDTLSQGNMTFAAEVTATNGFSGTANWTQLNNRTASYPNAGQDTDGQFWLDNTLFYNDGIGSDDPPTIVDPRNTVYFKDSPGVADDHIPESISDEFETYLVFKPDNVGNQTNIWVPLGIVTWSWSASKGFFSFNTTNVVQATYTNSIAFPIWTNTAYNKGH